MSRHTEQLVGVLFRVLREEGYLAAQQKLVESYQSAVTTARADLVDHLIADLIAAFHEHLSVQEEIDREFAPSFVASGTGFTAGNLLGRLRVGRRSDCPSDRL